MLFGLLMVLPSIFTRAYVELSFYIYLMKIRHKELVVDNVDIGSLNKLLSLSFNKSSVILPLETYAWIWGDAGEDHLIRIGDKQVSVCDMVRDSARLKENRSVLVNYFVSRLPQWVVKKLCKGPNESYAVNLLTVRQDMSMLLTEC